MNIHRHSLVFVEVHVMDDVAQPSHRANVHGCSSVFVAVRYLLLMLVAVLFPYYFHGHSAQNCGGRSLSNTCSQERRSHDLYDYICVLHGSMLRCAIESQSERSLMLTGFRCCSLMFVAVILPNSIQAAQNL